MNLSRQKVSQYHQLSAWKNIENHTYMLYEMAYLVSLAALLNRFFFFDLKDLCKYLLYMTIKKKKRPKHSHETLILI